MPLCARSTAAAGVAASAAVGLASRRLAGFLPRHPAIHRRRRPASPATASFSAGALGGSTSTRNQIYDPVRNTDALNTYLLLSTSSRRPLLTLWTTSYCPSCATVLPLITSLIRSGTGESEGGVSFANVEFDAPDIMSASPSPAMTYMITSVPTLLSFDAGEAVTSTKVTDVRLMSDRDFLTEWIKAEARRNGDRGGGGGYGGRGGMAFGGLFGS